MAAWGRGLLFTVFFFPPKTLLQHMEHMEKLANQGSDRHGLFDRVFNVSSVVSSAGTALTQGRLCLPQAYAFFLTGLTDTIDRIAKESKHGSVVMLVAGRGEIVSLSFLSLTVAAGGQQRTTTASTVRC